MKNLKKLKQFFKPGIRAKLIVFTVILLFIFGFLSVLYFNFKQREWIAGIFEKEIQAPLSYINSLSLEMDNLAYTLVLVEDMKNRIKSKEKELQKFKTKIVSNNNSALFGIFSSSDRKVMYKDSYFSQYLSEKEILELTEKIKNQFRDENGVEIDDSTFGSILTIARNVAIIQSRIENLESKSTKTNREENILSRDRNLLSRQNKYLRERIQNFFRDRNRDNIEELGFNPRNVRIQSYDREQNLFLDTGRLIQGSSFSSRRLLTLPEYESEKSDLFKFSDEELVQSKPEKTRSYEIGRNFFDVISRPFYKNPVLTSRSAIILSEMAADDSEWLELVRDDQTLTFAFSELIDRIRERRDELIASNTPPYKDKVYKDLYKEYRELLKKRESTFQRLHPYPNENKKRREDIQESIKKLEDSAILVEKNIRNLLDESKLALQRNEEEQSIRLEKEAENLGSDLENLREEIAQLQYTITSWNEYPRLKLAESFQNLREAALKSYIVLPYQNDSLEYNKFLRDNEIFNGEHRRWKHIRNWIMDGQSETSIPDLYLPGRKKVQTIENGILSRSRMEAEEYQWFIDSTPIYSYPDTGRSLSHILLSRNLAGYNIILIDRSENVKQIQDSLVRLMQVSGLLGFIFLIIAIVSSNYAVKRIRKITENTEKVGEGDLEVDFPQKGWDEIASLGRTLNTMVKGLREREELRGELEAAEEIQKRLLPDKLPAIEGLEFGAFYKAMNGVGGDYYDFIELNNRIYFCVGDVSNHGVGPALVMALLRSQLHSLIRRGIQDPKKILLDLNAFLYADTPDTIFVTFFLAMYDKRNHDIIYSSAGHNKPIIYRKKDDSVKLLKGGGLPLGMDDNEFFETTIELRKTTLELGDFFFQFTDGVTEAMNDSREQFGNEKLYNIIKNNQNLKPQDLIEKIARDVEEFSGKKIFCEGPSELNDDIAMVGIRRL
ncbi:SpoIIE family protein phosphatase [Leptospira sp. GIMC2001]|uniref:SpoIIE family protein phosphatase n=1 Tax=Leptospira sp. GIMC2001 TaxID=1513297 RepID=UPI00234B993B|nr:SpoIIE family protein phosphatase [Leptospira sp. GIMC2001]WCL50501.1 SpoIIE family protein phosphatase [Leptospira sp. GIMC2001]